MTRNSTSAINWPDEFDRTDSDERDSYPGNLTMGHRESFESIVEELERWGATDVEVDFAAPAYQRNSNIPHKSADVDDPGVVAYFRRAEGSADEGHAIACDSWETLQENARAIALYARRKRLAERCGVTTAESEFETTALPPGDEDDVIAAGPGGNGAGTPPHEILEVAPDASEDVVESVARRKMANVHPDKPDGDHDEYIRIQQAKEAMLNE